jgi:hypothetical protein
MNMRDLMRLCEDAATPFQPEAPAPQDAAPEQTPFEKWFAGSKIVDASGNPLKVYHGTSKDQNFRAFKMNKNGIWFTADPAEASQYSVENDSMGHKYDNGKFNPVHTASRVIPCYVRALKVMYYDVWPDQIRLADNYKRAQGIVFDQLRSQGYDAVVTGGLVVAIGSPNQIKSAIGNQKFDPSKKNIDEDDDDPSTKS